MAAKQTIEIVIDRDGQLEIEGQNFVGSACNKAMKFLEGLGKVVKRIRTGGKAPGRKVSVSG